MISVGTFFDEIMKRNRVFKTRPTAEVQKKPKSYRSGKGRVNDIWISGFQHDSKTPDSQDSSLLARPKAHSALSNALRNDRILFVALYFREPRTAVEFATAVPPCQNRRTTHLLPHPHRTPSSTTPETDTARSLRGARA